MSVYFFQGGPSRHDPIKIGWAKSAVARYAKLQAGCPNGLHYVASFSGERAEEALLHSKFSALRYRNEWFFAGTDLINFIQRGIWDDQINLTKAGSSYIIPPLKRERADLDPQVNFGGYGIAMLKATWPLSTALAAIEQEKAG